MTVRALFFNLASVLLMCGIVSQLIALIHFSFATCKRTTDHNYLTRFMVVFIYFFCFHLLMSHCDLLIQFTLLMCLKFVSRVTMSTHAERDIVMANLSVCLSVRHTLVLYRNECTYRQTLCTRSFWALPSLQNPKGNSLSGASNIRV